MRRKLTGTLRIGPLDHLVPENLKFQSKFSEQLKSVFFVIRV